MKINTLIYTILDNYKVENTALAVTYLLMLHHEIADEADKIIPEEVWRQVNLTKIVERDYEAKTLKWNIPLYEAEAFENKAWEWLQDFRKLFGDIRPDAIGSKSAVEKKMRHYFATHPEVRASDVMEAAKLYISNFSGNIKYLQQADYFISKLVRIEGSAAMSSRLDMYLEIIAKRDAEGALDTNKHMSQVVR